MGANTLPLVLIHGYPLSHTMWFGVIASLGAGIRSYAPDLPGFGSSMPATGEPSIDAMADAVLAQMKADRVERAVVAGMSMGGYVALAMAEKAPEKMGGLALVSTQTFADSNEAKAARREMIKKVRGEGPSAASKAILPKLFTEARASDPGYQRFPREGAEAAGIDGIAYALEAMARRPDRSRIVAEASFPVLILHGADDRIIPLEKAREIAALNPSAFLKPIKAGSHGIVIENPDEVADALRRFVNICSEPKPVETGTSA
jgi:pimeloyl-ACP methyl ester carboxylesterase